jgi:hypothetical protein
MTDHDVTNLPPPPPTPATPTRATNPNLKWWVALGAAAVLGVAAFFVFWGGDDGGDVSSDDPVTTSAVEVDDSALTAELAAAQAATESARAEVVAVQARMAELEAQQAGAVDASELEAVRAELTQATAALEATQGLYPVRVPDVMTATVVASYQVQWGETTTCEGLVDCSLQPDTFTELYISFDPVSENYPLVVPDVIEVSMVLYDGVLFGSRSDLPDIGLTCDAAAGLPIQGFYIVNLYPTSIALTPEGTPQVQELSGSVRRSSFFDGACPGLYLDRDVVLTRMS